MTRRLYTFRISEPALQNEDNTSQKALERLAALEGQGSVSVTGSEPGDVRLDGQFRDDYAELLGAELRELFSGSAIEYVEYYRVGDDSPDAGYYPVEQNRGGRIQPQTGGVVGFDLSLSREGTRTSHRRRVSTEPASVTHQFGTATDASVGVPAEATDVHWLDADTTTIADASPDTTETAEFGDVDLYRADKAPTGDRPQLVFDVPYQDAGDVDAAVFDTWGNPEIDASGRFAWQQVYDPAHEYRGDLVIENGIVELVIDLSTDPLDVTVSTYAGGSWSQVSLGTSDWRLDSIDVQTITPMAIRGRTRWRDTTGSDTHSLDFALHRGWDDVQFFEPTDANGDLLQSSQAPSGLNDRLTPIASLTLTDPDPRRGLIPRANLPL